MKYLSLTNAQRAELNRAADRDAAFWKKRAGEMQRNEELAAAAESGDAQGVEARSRMSLGLIEELDIQELVRINRDMFNTLLRVGAECGALRPKAVDIFKREFLHVSGEDMSPVQISELHAEYARMCIAEVHPHPGTRSSVLAYTNALLDNQAYTKGVFDGMNNIEREFGKQGVRKALVQEIVGGEVTDEEVASALGEISEEDMLKGILSDPTFADALEKAKKQFGGENVPYAKKGAIYVQRSSPVTKRVKQSVGTATTATRARQPSWETLDDLYAQSGIFNDFGKVCEVVKERCPDDTQELNWDQKEINKALKKQYEIFQNDSNPRNLELYQASIGILRNVPWVISDWDVINKITVLAITEPSVQFLARLAADDIQRVRIDSVTSEPEALLKRARNVMLAWNATDTGQGVVDDTSKVRGNGGFPIDALPINVLAICDVIVNATETSLNTTSGGSASGTSANMPESTQSTIALSFPILKNVLGYLGSLKNTLSNAPEGFAADVREVFAAVPEYNASSPPRSVTGAAEYLRVAKLAKDALITLNEEQFLCPNTLRELAEEARKNPQESGLANFSYFKFIKSPFYTPNPQVQSTYRERLTVYAHRFEREKAMSVAKNEIFVHLFGNTTALAASELFKGPLTQETLATLLQVLKGNVRVNETDTSNQVERLNYMAFSSITGDAGSQWQPCKQFFNASEQVTVRDHNIAIASCAVYNTLIRKLDDTIRPYVVDSVDDIPSVFSSATNLENTKDFIKAAINYAVRLEFDDKPRYSEYSEIKKDILDVTQSMTPNIQQRLGVLAKNITEFVHKKEFSKDAALEQSRRIVYTKEELVNQTHILEMSPRLFESTGEYDFNAPSNFTTLQKAYVAMRTVEMRGETPQASSANATQAPNKAENGTEERQVVALGRAALQRLSVMRLAHSIAKVAYHVVEFLIPGLLSSFNATNKELQFSIYMRAWKEKCTSEGGFGNRQLGNYLCAHYAILSGAEFAGLFTTQSLWRGLVRVVPPLILGLAAASVLGYTAEYFASSETVASFSEPSETLVGVSEYFGFSAASAVGSIAVAAAITVPPAFMSLIGRAPTNFSSTRFAYDALVTVASLSGAALTLSAFWQLATVSNAVTLAMFAGSAKLAIGRGFVRKVLSRPIDFFLGKLCGKLGRPDPDAFYDKFRPEWYHPYGNKEWIGKNVVRNRTVSSVLAAVEAWASSDAAVVMALSYFGILERNGLETYALPIMEQARHYVWNNAETSAKITRNAGIAVPTLDGNAALLSTALSGRLAEGLATAVYGLVKNFITKTFTGRHHEMLYKLRVVKANGERLLQSTKNPGQRDDLKAMIESLQEKITRVENNPELYKFLATRLSTTVTENDAARAEYLRGTAAPSVWENARDAVDAVRVLFDEEKLPVSEDELKTFNWLFEDALKSVQPGGSLLGQFASALASNSVLALVSWFHEERTLAAPADALIKLTRITEVFSDVLSEGAQGYVQETVRWLQSTGTDIFASLHQITVTVTPEQFAGVVLSVEVAKMLAPPIAFVLFGWLIPRVLSFVIRILGGISTGGKKFFNFLDPVGIFLKSKSRIIDALLPTICRDIGRVPPAIMLVNAAITMAALYVISGPDESVKEDLLREVALGMLTVQRDKRLAGIDVLRTYESKAASFNPADFEYPLYVNRDFMDVFYRNIPDIFQYDAFIGLLKQGVGCEAKPFPRNFLAVVSVRERLMNTIFTAAPPGETMSNHMKTFVMGFAASLVEKAKQLGNEHRKGSILTPYLGQFQKDTAGDNASSMELRKRAGELLSKLLAVLVLFALEWKRLLKEGKGLIRARYKTRNNAEANSNQ
jgi:hypothetical protein